MWKEWVMNRRWVIRLSLLVGVCALVGGVLVSGVLAQPGMPDPNSDDPVERGQYLFYIEYGCIGCHVGPNADGSMPEDMGAALPSGGEPFDLGFAVFYARNLTQLGDWSADEIETALRYGVSPDGEAYVPIMPFTLYETIIDEDMADLTAFLQSMEPVENEIAEAEFRDPSMSRDMFMTQAEIDIERERPTPDFSDPVARGGYLANVVSCMHCHGEIVNDVIVIPYPDGLPHGWIGPTLLPAGVAERTDEELRATIIGGKGEMMPPHFLPEEDIDALVAWIRSLPDVEPMPVEFMFMEEGGEEPAATPES
jgi:hypothetical protein